MNYTDAKSIIRSGDLLVWSGRSTFSKLIQLFTRSQITHVGIALWLPFDADRRLYVAESTSSAGVQFAPLSMAGDFAFLPYPDSMEWTPEAEQFVISRVGKTPYDWTSILRSALGLRMVDDNRMTCNEFAARVSSKMGLKLLSENSTQSPVGLAREWLNNGASLHPVHNPS